MLIRLLTLVLLLMLTPFCTAQNWPQANKPIRIVLPFPAGGAGTDMMARLFAKKLNEQLGVSVIVDNKPGASTIIGAQEVAKAAADGHTLLYTIVLTHAQNPHLFNKLPYDPFKDFTALSQVARSATVLIAHPTAPFNTLSEMVVYGKANPGKITIGSFSPGSTAHLNAEMLGRQAGLDVVHVPYKGSADLSRALLAGEIMLAFDGTASAVTLIKAKRLKGIATATDKRIPILPDLPTIAEQGVAGIDIVGWQGFFAPGNMAPELANKIAAALAAITRSTDVTELIVSQGNEASGNTPAEFAAIVKQDHARWGEVIRKIGVKLD
jgi:tripartite-type tricarboxylate transporter receptor subunit TctC